MVEADTTIYAFCLCQIFVQNASIQYCTARNRLGFSAAIRIIFGTVQLTCVWYYLVL